MNITISLEEYNELKYKEFVYDFERAQHAEKITNGRYVDIADKILYELIDPLEEATAKIRERLEKEKEEKDW